MGGLRLQQRGGEREGDCRGDEKELGAGETSECGGGVERECACM